MTELSEQLITSQSLYQGKLISLRVDTVGLPNGHQTSREIVEHPGAVAMVPLLPDGRVMLVRQYRYAAGRVLLEIPAGALDSGEDPLTAAARELQEEIGYKPGALVRLGGIFAAPSYDKEYIHLYLATDLEASTLARDEDEQLEIVTMPLEEAVQLAENGGIEDGKTISALLLVMRRLGR